ncbi:MAG: FAD-dependent oxidoreductase [Solirubrobacteraceae bacterium]
MGPGVQTLITEYQLDADHILVSGFGAEGLYPLDPNDRDQVQTAVERFMIGAKVLEVDALDFNTDPFSDGTWQINLPGWARRFRKIMNELEGRLYFAGSDASLSLLNGWMEGAVARGYRAVERVCAHLGKIDSPAPNAHPATDGAPA